MIFKACCLSLLAFQTAEANIIQTCTSPHSEPVFERLECGGSQLSSNRKKGCGVLRSDRMRAEKRFLESIRPYLDLIRQKPRIQPHHSYLASTRSG